MTVCSTEVRSWLAGVVSQFHSGSVSESVSIKSDEFDPDSDTDTDPDGLPTAKPILALRTYCTDVLRML